MEPPIHSFIDILKVKEPKLEEHRLKNPEDSKSIF